MAAYLGFDFVDAGGGCPFDDDGSFNADVTNDLLSEKLKDKHTAVIPGFYGAKADGEVVTFSRGGSDITGSLVALAVGADLYENWTDVSGFLIADPRIVKNRGPSRRSHTKSCGEPVLHGRQCTPRRCDLPGA